LPLVRPVDLVEISCRAVNAASSHVESRVEATGAYIATRL
jgi:hypothetical protein